MPRIDHQHEAFVDLFNDFESALLENVSKKELLGILNEIALFTKFHFCCEEDVMEKIGYRGFDEHRAKHLQGIDTLSNPILSLTQGRISPEEIQAILKDWLFQHAMIEDRKIAEFANRRS